MIIQSLLDTDLYKLSMMQFVLHQFPGVTAEYQFKCRNPEVDLRSYAAEIRTEISHLCQHRFQPDELAYLRTLRYMKSDFIEFLRIFQLCSDFVDVNDAGSELEITIKGPWLHTIMFEVPILAIISEIYHRHQLSEPNYTEGRRRLQEKISFLKQNEPTGKFKFSDFGTRRRFSKIWHEEVIQTLKAQLPEYFAGTSNVYFAKKYDLIPIGTMAHEYIQAFQSLGPRLAYSQKFALEKWAVEYRGDLGIALSDTYNIDAFLRDFDLYFCKLFDGVRQDSGNPIASGQKIIDHYKKMRINPKTKTLVFSDSLTFPRALELYHIFHSEINPAFGIGTNLTNDLGCNTIQIVIKMTQCNGQPVAKLSDSPEKTICKDKTYLEYLKKVFSVEPK